MDGSPDKLGAGGYPACGEPDNNERFSWFDYRSKGFDDNRGLRIDLLLASSPLAERCIETGIDYDIRSMDKPSDHAPVWATFNVE